MEKEQSQDNPKNMSEKEEEVKSPSDQTSKNSETDELAADGLSQNPSEEAKEEEKSPEEKILELEDKLARTFAEMENQRRRFEKEKEDAYEYGGFAFAKEALNLIDNLERSKQILSNDESIKNSESLKKTLEHFDIINKDLISIFSKNNIKPIESLNKKLDPNFHQAMIEIEDDEKEPGTIIQEIQKGFTIKDRLLRPSLVGVAKKKLVKTKKDEENKDNLKEK
ncbi:nucleotide exchange factor GrpE [Pelagibacterales bacterium SAG-MED37]|nr:nucleotide exchange factor GrpE [Pelagibacterales bacterium SAG-MED37]